MSQLSSARWSFFACLVLAVFSPAAFAQPAAVEATAFTIAGGGLSLNAPAGFQRVRPKSGMVETEFAIPSEGDSPAGRMTVMGAGGSVQANVDRWAGQFSQPDGGCDQGQTHHEEVRDCRLPGHARRHQRNLPRSAGR